MPVATPVTTPNALTIAIAVLLLAHTPPEEGPNDVVVPLHTLVAPTIGTATGKAFIVTGVVEETLPQAFVIV